MSASSRRLRGNFLLQCGAYRFDFLVCQVLDSYELVACVVHGANELIELGLDSGGITVLRILY